jgi:tetratricopeptide (TPR) repeat protein
LLEQGLVDEPDNGRYMFYLAQTFKCIGKYKEAIDMYKKRIKAGGWDEEVWHSYYSIGDCWKGLGDVIQFEKYMQLAHKFRPHRVESIIKLAEHYRTVGQHYKSYHYISVGRSVPFPDKDVLFIESNVYNGLFDYEASIVEYYIYPERGLKTSIIAMLRNGIQYQANMISNLKFYAKPLESRIENLNLPRPFGEDFTPSAISLDVYPMANVRYKNYWMANGEYFTKDSVPVQTHNAYINLETGEVICSMKDTSVTNPRFNTNVKGLEDVRLFTKDDKLKFTATSVNEYAEGLVRVVSGDYNKDGIYSNVCVLKSPTDSSCEKNWLPISGTDNFIYGWHPYRIVNSNSETILQRKTPEFFTYLRGSAPPIKHGDRYWVLVHFVEYSKLRVYHHCLVELNNSYIPTKISIPFVFKSPSVEYCVSFRFVGNDLEFYASFMDNDPCKITIPINKFEWFNLN